MLSNDDLERLSSILPFYIQQRLIKYIYKHQLLEIVLDLGRRPEARFLDDSIYLSQKLVSWQDLEFITKRIGKFNNENRAGIDHSLHRISCLRNRQFLIIGLTCRIGRTIFGTISIIRDLLELEKSMLILGKPGVGKTTIIREISRILADELEKRIIIIDTSNEISGNSDIPHFGIGQARRMQVPKTELQHQIMIEAVENHMPQVIVIDEIGTELEVLAARTIAEKGVLLIGTTHGTCISNLIKNPSLSDLIGGIEYVTLSDDEAKRRNCKKSILERKAYPTFELIVEINDKESWTIYENSQYSVDNILLGRTNINQIRRLVSNSKIQIKHKHILKSPLIPVTPNMYFPETSWVQLNKQTFVSSRDPQSYDFSIYSYSISNNLLKEVFSKLGMTITLTTDIKKASLIIGLKSHLKRNFKLRELAKKKEIPVYSINQISIYQLIKLLVRFKN